MEGVLSLTQMSRRRRNILLACCALGAGGYFSYRVYTSRAVARKREQLYKFFHALSSLLELYAQGSDCLGILWKDLHSFILSEEDEVPQTLKQLFKIGQTQDFQKSMALLCGSITQGVVSSLSGNYGHLQDSRDYGSALCEELASQFESFPRIGRQGRNLGGEEVSGGHRSFKARRWRSSGEADGPHFRDSVEDDYKYWPGKCELGESSSRVDGVEGRPLRDEDDERRYSSWNATRSYYREKGSWAAAPVAKMGGDAWKGKSRYQGERRGRVEGQLDGFSERLLGKLFSEAGQGFASAVVASAARGFTLSIIQGFQETRKRDPIWSSSFGSEPPQQSRPEADGHIGESHSGPSSSPPSAAFASFQDGVIDFLCSSRGKSLVADCIEAFVGTAVSVYLDRTRDVNVCDRFVSTLSKPEHREPVKEFFTSMCNGAVETLIRASSDVLAADRTSRRAPQINLESTAAKFGMGSSLQAKHPEDTLGKCDCLDHAFGHPEMKEWGEVGSSGTNEHFSSGSPSPSPRTPVRQGEGSLAVPGLTSVRIAFDHSPPSEKKQLQSDEEKMEAIALPPSSSSVQRNAQRALLSARSTDISQGLIDGVSRTLAVPSNRALVLDVAGTVTAEAVRSAIEVVATKLSLSLRGKSKQSATAAAAPSAEGKPSSSKVLHAINRTGELAQATAAKAMVAMTMCIAICLHTLVGPSRVFQLS